jgi:ATP-dependent helicase/nuclease subunit A
VRQASDHVNIRIITASAGSGKTYRLTQELDQAIASGKARPAGIVATTFTKHAAAELIERARTRLLRNQRGLEAHQLLAARIGTINSICGSLVTDFAFELGMSPELRVLNEAAAELAFRRTLARVVSSEMADALGLLQSRFEQDFDWRTEVRRIVEAARANGIDGAHLKVCAARSIAELDACMGPVDTEADLEGELAEAIAEAIENLPGVGDDTKGTAEYLELLRDRADALASHHLTWGDWAKLTSSKPTKKSLELAAPVQAAAARHLAHPALREQMHALIEHLFSIAAESLSAYQEYKRDRAVIDFIDQETLALEALQRADVRDALAGQLDLVLIDEFQDTSPIQLAVFLALASLAKESIWVGDPKQAIYGFRGTDPGLMDSAIESMSSTETDPDLVANAARAVTSKIDVLDTSYRSRPELVHVTSEIFARAFASQGMPEERTRLEPALAEEPAGLGDILEYWPLDKVKNNGERARAVAAGVRDLLQREVQVRGSNDVRAAQRSDVAVLCRTNAQCQEVADALAALDVAVVVPRMSLLETTEATIVEAALRLWADPGDALAAAEIARVISYPGDLDGLVARAIEKPGREAFADEPTVARLLAARGQARDLDPLSTLDAVFAATAVRTLCAEWGRTAQRLANLDALRAHAVGYVDEAIANGDAPTLVGLIGRLSEITDDAWGAHRTDTQALLAGEDAVTVSTWHRAKGLEWPVTVLFGLEGMREPYAHGVHVMSDRREFVIEDPLGGRWIRCWPNVYTTANQKGPVREAFERSPAHAGLVARAEREALRVLYVGWTRARDRLIFAVQRGKLLAGIVGTLATIDPALISEPAAEQAGREAITWAGVATSIGVVPCEPAPELSRPPEPGVIAELGVPRARAAARVSPSSAAAIECSHGQIVRIGPRIGVKGSPDMEDVGHAMHAFLAADRPGIPTEERLAMATELLARFEVGTHLEPAQVLEAAERFHAWVDTTFVGARLQREYPVLHRPFEQGLVSGTADLILRCGSETVIIDHKSFPGDEGRAQERAKSYAGQLATYAAAVRAAGSSSSIRTWIHFPVVGIAVEIALAI